MTKFKVGQTLYKVYDDGLGDEPEPKLIITKAEIIKVTGKRIVIGIPQDNVSPLSFNCKCHFDKDDQNLHTSKEIAIAYYIKQVNDKMKNRKEQIVRLQQELKVLETLK